MNEAVQKFLNADIIEISPTQNTDYLSNFFTIQEPTKRRSILDCQKINNYIQCLHFKIEGIPELREIMEKNNYICKLNLKDAYVVVELHPQSRKYLTFMNQGIVYQYKTLAFGMSVSPRVFSKMMRFAVEQLRKEGIRLVYNLDDVCLLAQTKEEMIKVSTRVITHLTSLGFMIKSREKYINAFAQTGVSRLFVQFDKYEGNDACQEDQQNDQSDKTSITTTKTVLPMEDSRLETIRMKRKKDGMTEDEMDFLEHTIRSNTQRVYNNGWRKWKNGVDSKNQ